MIQPTPRVLDTSHYNKIVTGGFDAVRDQDIWGVIQKATDGADLADNTYAARRPQIVAAGLLEGAYHFMRPAQGEHMQLMVAAQVENFLRMAAPTDSSLMALDYELGTVPLAAAREFVERVHDKTGRWPWLYSGNTIKEKLGPHSDPFWGRLHLWLAQYASTPVPQRSWSSPSLWQYTDGEHGPKPHRVNGVCVTGGGTDISHFAGTRAELEAIWAATAERDPVPAHDIDGGSDGVRRVQAMLNAIGYGPLKIDGDPGPRTLRAVQSFKALHQTIKEGDNSITSTIDSTFISELARAVTDALGLDQADPEFDALVHDVNAQADGLASDAKQAAQ